jgi:hypothetical protein
MRPVISELLNPSCLTHLVAMDIELQSIVILTIGILIFFQIMKFHIINLGMMCKVHVISI